MSLTIALEPLRRELPRGAVLWMLPRPDPRVACLEAYLPAGLRTEPADRAGVASLMGRTLAEGTPERTGDQIADAIESVGGDLILTPVGGWTELDADNLLLGAELLLDSLARPTFPADRVELARRRQTASLQAARDDPATRAHRAFDAAVYGDHPFGRDPEGTDATLATLTRDDCARFHADHAAPERLTLAAAGAFDPEALVDHLSELIERWPDRSLPPLALPDPPPAPTARRLRVELAGDKSQCHVFLGHLGVRRSDPDFDALIVADHILGIGPGFTDRLSRELRDEAGLAYHLYASITSTAHLEPGTFHAYIGTSPDLAPRAIDAMRAAIHRLRDEPVSADELADVQAYLVGSAVFRYQTVRQLARYLIQRAKFDLGDHHAIFADRIARVTAGDVQAAARRHLHPDAMTELVALSSD